MAKFLAIDPGKDGFLAGIDDGEWCFWPMPVVKSAGGGKREYDLYACADILRTFEPDQLIVEKQQAGSFRPGAKGGATSAFSTGYGYGIWLALAAAFYIPVLSPAPRSWQAVMCCDLPGEDPKARALLAAQRRFPGIDLRATERCTKPHSGKVDAMLMAAWGMTQ